MYSVVRLRRLGFALATTFMVAFIVLLAGFTMAGIASFNYNLAKQAQLRDEAFDAANAGLNYAMQQLIQDQSWGAAQPVDRTTDTLPQPSITVNASSSDPQYFYVSFQDPAVHPSPPAGYPTDLPWSVNNLSGGQTINGPPDLANKGLPHQVPPGSALIFSEGVAGSGSQRQVRILEALLQAPAYPFAISATSAVAAWCTCFVYNICPRCATLVDAKAPCTCGSVLVKALPCIPYQPWCGDTRPQPCVTPPYGVFLAHGSVVTGNVVSQGPTNLQPCCCPKPFKFPCQIPCNKPAVARKILRLAPPCCTQADSQQLPCIPALASPLVKLYTCPNTYVPCGSPVGTTATPRCVTLATEGGPHCPPSVSVRVYTKGTFCPTSRPVVISGCTLLVAPVHQPPYTLKLGCCGIRVELSADSTLTVQNAYLDMPGGFIGCGFSPWVSGTVLILPVSLCAKLGPSFQAASRINLIPGGGLTGALADVSVLAVGNLTLGAKGGICSGAPWTLNGLLASYGGSLQFTYKDAHIVGIMLAEDPWRQHWCCCFGGGSANCGTLGYVFMSHGAWVSYSAPIARTTWLGQAIGHADTRGGMKVVYWRDIRPGF